MKRVHLSLLQRPVRAGAIVALGLATAMTGATATSAALGRATAMTGAVATSAAAAAPTAPRFVALAGSAPSLHAAAIGSYNAARMSVEVALAPRNQAGLAAQLKAQYTAESDSYHRWLAKGQFDARYAPTAATRAAVSRYLSDNGLTVVNSPSPFLVRAMGSSQRVGSAFRTTLSSYRDSSGARFFGNSTAVRLPASLAPLVQGVIGLSNTVREHGNATPVELAARPGKRATPRSVGCQTSYPTDAQLFNYVATKQWFPFGYGGAPACTGLTPSQVNSIYGAPNVGPRGEGSGVTLAVAEFSAYQESDITTWAHTFYGTGYAPTLKNEIVDGGPLNPECPVGDTCPPDINGYADDLEVDLDIQRELTISPDAAQILVYNAPNDYTGQTVLDEYTKIANDDTAAAVSTSWTACEQVFGSAFVQSENVVFEQMATQGQSFFASSGDAGAFGCYPFTGSTAANVNDPAAQPWVTGVGGTSLENYDPGTSPVAGYPPSGESAWNVNNLCQNTTANEGGIPADEWCAQAGPAGGGSAGGGGSSMFWGRPFYQIGPGVTSSSTTYGNGTTQCALAAVNTPCREVPDISADADFFTPYAEYCTGNASEAYSVCASSALTSTENAPGWFGVAGTSSSSPLWAGIAADRDSYTGSRSGFFNPLLYQMFNTDPGEFFHDVTSAGQPVTDNGIFPATAGYDEATGIGTPKMAALITENP
jgi:subtilase family serine protease